MLNPLKLISTFFCFIIASSSFGANCLGLKDSKSFAIYLHGTDTDIPSAQEFTNRELLSRISNSLKIGIVLPRSKDKCTADKRFICWGSDYNDPKLLNSVFTAAVTEAKNCFPDAKPAVLIGFSNGGYIVNQILQNCRKTIFEWLVSIGAGGSWSKTEISDQSRCGNLFLFARNEDKVSYQPLKDFNSWLKNRKAQGKNLETEENIIVPDKSLEEELKKILKK